MRIIGTMLSKLEPACLVIADISGYTGYLAGTELDHAQDVLADLMDTVVGALRPTFRLAKLEGDAAFVYVVTETIDGSALQDSVERCYFAFRRRLRDIKQASSCECNACILIPALNLKFVAHHGTIGRQRIAGWEELVGSDVIVVHRLLKNHVEVTLGLGAYAMYTDSCLRAMGARDPAALGLREHREAFEGVGEVVGWARDLEAAWREEQERRRVFVRPEDAMWSIERFFAAPPELVWDYVTSPARRPKWQAGVTGVVEETPTGRRGAGTTNHCMHGKDAIVEEVLDWRPYEYWTSRFQMPMPGIPKMTESDAFEPAPGGTIVRMTIARLRSAKDRAAVEPLAPMLEEMVRAGLDALEPILADEMAARTSTAAEAREPEVPRSEGRHLREPLPGPIVYVDSGASRSS